MSSVGARGLVELVDELEARVRYPLHEQLGRAVAPVPYLTSAVVATEALLASDADDLLAELASGRRIGVLAVSLSVAPGDAHKPVRLENGSLHGELTGIADAAAADVLLVPHHGSARQDADFLAAATPAVAVVSVGEDNDHGHPAERTLQTVAGLGASVFRTDLNGSVAVTAGPAGLSVTTER